MRVEHVHNVRVAVCCDLVGRRARLQIAQRAGQDFGFRLHVAEFVKDAETLFKHGFTAHGQAVLRKVAEGHALGAGDSAIVDGLDAGEDFKQR